MTSRSNDRDDAMAGLGANGERAPKWRKRRVPVVQQTTAADCGAACLAMVMRYHGRHVGLEEVRAAAGTDTNGTSARALIDLARGYGLRARGISIDADALPLLGRGSVLHWGFRHFVVFESTSKRGVDVVDPGYGRRRIPLDEFRKMFTGVALTFEPTDAFETVSDSGRKTWKYVRRILGRSGFLARITVVSALIQLFGLGLPLLTGLVVDRVIPLRDVDLLHVVGAGLAGFVVFWFVAALLRSHLLLYLRTQLDAEMTVGFLEHLVSLPYAFFQQRASGDLMMRMNSNTIVREILTSSTLSGALDGVLVLSYLILMLVVNVEMGLLVLGLALLRVLVFLVSRHRVRDRMTDTLQRQAEAQSYQVQLLAGIETLKAMGAEHRAVERWSNLYVDVLNASLRRGRLNALLQAIHGSFGTMSPLLVLGVGAGLVLRGDLSLGTMLALNALAAGFLAPLSTLIATATQVQELGSYVDRLDDVLDTEPEQDSAQSRSLELRGRIELDGVSFRYGPMSPFAVSDVSLRIESGQQVAVVGRSASGKTTLAGLMMGLYRPTAGRVLYDGEDLATLDVRAVRRQLGIVTQHAYLFGASIRDNIALSDPELPLSAVMDAARLAHIHDEIEAMPMGYETLLVDSGSALSGGQLQRIALARALVRRPAILLLDEATSALDASTERQIQESIASLACTRIIIAHRLSTVAGADVIIVLDGGRIAETGTHAELVARHGLYHALLGGQLTG